MSGEKKSVTAISDADRKLHDRNDVLLTIGKDKNLQGFDLRICLILGADIYRSQEEICNLLGAHKSNVSRSLSKLVSYGYVFKRAITDHHFVYRLASSKYEVFTRGSAGHQEELHFD